MIVGHFASRAYVQKGYGANASSHIQIPTESLRQLSMAGHDVHFITSKVPETHELPDFIPPSAEVHLVPDWRTDTSTQLSFEESEVRTDVGLSDSFPSPRSNPFRILKLLRGIMRVTRSQRLDVLHLFGSSRIALLIPTLRLMGLRTPLFVTLLSANLHRLDTELLLRFLGRANGVITATQYLCRKLRARGIPATLARHGPIRPLSYEGSPDGSRVLFWRDPTFENGADVSVEVFRRLAPEFPNHSFDMAIRPWTYEVPGLSGLSALPNVRIHRFPYEDGISIEKLVCTSRCILLPMRVLSVHPQLAILESLAAGVPVIAARVDSVPELIQHGSNGFLVDPGEVEETTRYVRCLLTDRSRAEKMGRTARQIVQEDWHWSDYAATLAQLYRTSATRATMP